MSNQLTTTSQVPTAVIESLALKGDISGLNPQQKVQYYAMVCERLGLDPTTQPFAPLKLNGKEILYASRGATDQLARVHKVNRNIISRERIDDVYVVTARASTPDGRVEESVGAVAIGALKGEALANALMKCETKAKRRATLSICGLGMMDESEMDTIPPASMTPLEPINISPVKTVEQLEPKHEQPKEFLPGLNLDPPVDNPPPSIRPKEAKCMELIAMLDMSREGYDDWAESKGLPKLADTPTERLDGCLKFLEKLVAQRQSKGAA